MEGKDTLAWREAVVTAARLARESLRRKKKEIQLLASGTKRKSEKITDFIVELGEAASVMDESGDESDNDSLVSFEDVTDESGVEPEYYNRWRPIELLAFQFLEELAVTFQIPLEGTSFRTFYGNIGDYILAILDPGNGALVLKALEDCVSHVMDYRLVGVCSRDERLSSNEVYHKSQFWDTLVEDGVAMELPYAYCEWQLAWRCYDNTEQWNATKNIRQLCCKQLIDAADMLKTLSDAYRWYDPDCAAEWLDRETHRMLDLYEAHTRDRKKTEG